MTEDKKKKNNPKNQKRRDKSFETTTRLHLSDTYEDDEITLKEELPEPPVNERTHEEEDSVTVKLSRPTPEGSVVARQLKKIQSGLVEREGEGNALCRIKSFLKFLSVTSGRVLARVVRRLSRISLRQRRTQLVAGVIAVVLVAGLVLFVCEWWGDTGSTQGDRRGMVFGKVAPLKLSPVTLTDLGGGEVPARKIRAGRSVELTFYVLRWNATADEQLKLTADVRVYAGTGKLLVYQPAFLRYAERTDPKRERVRVKTRLNLDKGLAPGYYRVLITVTETATGQKANIVKRIKVVP